MCDNQLILKFHENRVGFLFIKVCNLNRQYIEIPKIEVRTELGELLNIVQFTPISHEVLSIQLEEGKYIIVISLPGYIPNFYSISIEHGQQHIINTVLLPLKTKEIKNEYDC